MRHLALALLLALALCGGCQQQTPPLTQVYTAKQVYTASLDTLTTLINTGRITDANTLMRIRDARLIVEAGLAEAERAARAGDTATFKTWMDRVNAALETYLKLQGPPTTTRPVSLIPHRWNETEEPRGNTCGSFHFPSRARKECSRPLSR